MRPIRITFSNITDIHRHWPNPLKANITYGIIAEYANGILSGKPEIHHGMLYVSKTVNS